MGTTIVKTEFDSITQYHAYLATTTRAEGANDVSAVEGRGHRWDGGLSLADAMGMAANGGYWPEGADNLMAANVQTDNALAQIVTDLDYQVTGHYLDVAEYVSGSPEHWLIDTEEGGQCPVIRIGVSVGRSASVDAEPIMNRGAAVLSVIDALERAGNRCELFAVECDAGSVSHQHSTKVKSSDESWSPHAVAFALCHPAYSRRLNFLKQETHPELVRMTHGGYGTPSNFGKGDYDLWLPAMTRNCGFETPEEAMRIVLEAVAAQGLTID